MPYMLQISTGRQMQAWLEFCTQWSALTIAGGLSEGGRTDMPHSAHKAPDAVPSGPPAVLSGPPDICALAFWSQDRLDAILQALQLLTAGPSLRAMSASQFRERYSHLHLEQLRWALQQMTVLSTSADGRSTGGDLQTFMACCETPQGRRALLWCSLMQVLPPRMSALGASLLLALGLDETPEDPYRVWLPQSAWANLIDIGTRVEGAQAEAYPASVVAPLIQPGPMRQPESESGFEGITGRGDHAVNSLDDIDRVRA